MKGMYVNNMLGIIVFKNYSNMTGHNYTGIAGDDVEICSAQPLDMIKDTLLAGFVVSIVKAVISAQHPHNEYLRRTILKSITRGVWIKEIKKFDIILYTYQF